MAHGSPDWVRQVQVVITEAEPKVEKAVTRLDRLTTTSTFYQEVVSWTVSTGKVGVLKLVAMESSKYDKTMFKLTIAGEVQFTDGEVLAPLNLQWPDVRLAAGSVVKLEAKSTDGTSVTVDGAITGKEVG